MAGPLSIKSSEILAYCVLFNISSQIERERLFDHVANLDTAYLGYVRDRQSDTKQTK